jgi:ABC-type enterochelin transport system ATPase subunit
MSTFSGGHGLCLDCILEVWGITNENLQQPKGILGRTKAIISNSWKSLASLISSSSSRTDLIKLSDTSFEELNNARSLAVLRHQADISQDELIVDLTQFARVYAVSQGRTSEKNFALTDVYHLVDWMRTHPILPTWAHGVTWLLARV